ncbi:TetR/AcrR family transcriptional regulator [Paenibacillus alba]|uniref:TetR/AcrR family transcriptional regulator n=1 Tax=Paenibacillus alba TaxID=1197127 RepID=A0ABU6G5G7_9BACL|nr:TetR/AcrR family transcriptional regulator [Paenibacillus alba]MEC0229417.1 TetR/AcrR family transcriptional regulator [Paenibacillus alba]NQX70284.1 TetR/AcrR family transcriptional regulator [Paenibacillus alba]
MNHTDDPKDSLYNLEFEAHTICGRREEKDSEYRRRILTTARNLFQTHAIETVTMHQIAKEAGVGQGTLYRRYAHIGEVCSDLLRSTTSQFIESLERSLTDPAPEIKAMSQVSNSIKLIIDFIDDKASLLSSVNMTYNDKGSFYLHKKPIFIRLHNILAPLMERAVQQGEIQPLDVTLTVNTILGSLMPDQYMYHREILGYTKEQFIEGICRLFVKGI